MLFPALHSGSSIQQQWKHTGTTRSKKSLKETIISWIHKQKRLPNTRQMKVMFSTWIFFFYPLENAFHNITGKETKQICLHRWKWSKGQKEWTEAKERDFCLKTSRQDVSIWVISRSEVNSINYLKNIFHLWLYLVVFLLPNTLHSRYMLILSFYLLLTFFFLLPNLT